MKEIYVFQDWHIMTINLEENSNFKTLVEMEKENIEKEDMVEIANVNECFFCYISKEKESIKEFAIMKLEEMKELTNFDSGFEEDICKKELVENFEKELLEF